MSDEGSPAAVSNGAAHPRTAPETSCSHRHSRIAHAACFDKSPWDTLTSESCRDTFRHLSVPSTRHYGWPVRTALVVPAAAILSGQPHQSNRRWTADRLTGDAIRVRATAISIKGSASQWQRELDQGPRITILSASSGSGRCSAFASSHGAHPHIHRHRPGGGSARE